MANIFLNIPVVMNGVGAPVNVSAMGASKTIVVQGGLAGILSLEITVDGGVTWCPVPAFAAAGNQVLPFAAEFIRARTKNVNPFAPFTAQVDVGANDDGGNYAVIPAPPLNGTGAPVNITAFGNFTTLIVGGTFGGGVIAVEFSENGVDFSEVQTFQNPGCINRNLVGDFCRAVSRGARSTVPFAPTCGIGATNDDNADNLTVEEEGVVVGSRPIMNFIGGAVTATDDPGNNRIDVTITAAALTALPPTQIDVGDAAVVGVGTSAAREDHQHALPAPAAPVTVTGGTNSAGVATTVARADHQHRLGLTVDEEGVAVGARPILNFIGGAVTAVDNPGLDRVDVTITAAALTNNPPTQIDIGDTAVVGVALTAAREDHQHALPVPTVVATLTPDNAPSLGVSTVVAREDHVHGIAADVPVNVDKSANVEGVSASFARADHKHDVTTAVPGTIVPDAAAAEGVAVSLARSDHTHAIAADVPVTVTGATNSEGVSVSFARADHQHRLALTVDEEGVAVGSRPILNFIGSSVTAVDNPGGDRVDVTITESGLASTMAAGAVGAPGISVVGDPNTGIYSPGADQFAIATGGVQAFLFTTQGGGFPVGAVGTPGLFVVGDTNTGIYSPAADQLAVAAGGSQIVLWTTQGLGINLGAAATPSLFVVGDTNSGLYSPGADQLSVSLAGAQVVGFTTQGMGNGLGAVGTPSIFIIGDTNTGIYSPGADQMAVTVGGAQVAIFAAQGIGTINGTAGAPAFYFSGDVDTGMHHPAANTLALDTGGAAKLTLSGAGGNFNISGTAAAPGIFFGSDTASGLYLIAAGSIALTATAGAAEVRVVAAQGVGFVISAGTAALPGLFIVGDTDTGFQNASGGANTLSVSTGGAERARFDNTAVANEVSLLVSVAGAAVKRVSQNAIADSGGVGFRMLIVPN